jgi:long-chain fatty acid transport protein
MENLSRVSRTFRTPILLRKGTLSFSVALALAVTSTPAAAAFFQIAENNVSGLGGAYSGGAAIAEDASTVWYNPAGMTRITGSQFAVAGHFIKPSTEFNKTSANITPTCPAGPCGSNISGNNGGDAGEDALVPNLFYTQQLSERLFLGVGINAPFGLATDYDDGWVGRYHANRSEIKTVNINPAIAYKINDQWSVGGGINYQKIEAELTQAIDFATLCTLGGASAACGAGAGFNTNNPNDGSARVEADDDAWGFNVGGLWQFADTRVGTHYRSKMKYKLKGDFDVSAPSNVPGAVLTSPTVGLVDSGVKADVTLPATLALSVNQKLGSQWTIMGDITRTFWSDLPELRIDFDSSQSDSVVTLNLDDVNRYSVGATFAPGGAWTYRFGVALDQTPTPSATDRTPRLPDEDRLWLALGASYKPSPTLSFDFAYVYIKIDDADIDKQAGTSNANENFLRGSLVGTYEATVQILSAQANWKF